MSISEEGDAYKPLVDNLIKFDQLSEKISENIGLIKDYIEILNEYKEKMGTADDTRTMRRKMTNEINDGNEVIKSTLELFEEFENLKFKRKKDIENFNKLSRRLSNTFDEDYDKFTKILKEIHSKEKIHLELKNSLNMNRSSDSSVLVSSEHMESEGNMHIDEQGDIEFIASIIEERQSVLDRRTVMRTKEPVNHPIRLNDDSDNGSQLVTKPRRKREKSFMSLITQCFKNCFGKSDERVSRESTSSMGSAGSDGVN